MQIECTPRKIVNEKVSNHLDTSEVYLERVKTVHFVTGGDTSSPVI